MTQGDRPSMDEVVLGAFLEDIGKFMQRAHPDGRGLPEQVMNRAGIVLPPFRGRYTHWHALWTDAFFQALEDRGVALPGGLNTARVRDAAVYHHSPGSPLAWLSAVSDRLSAGMDRKKRDEEAEGGEAPSPAGFRKVPLRSVFSAVSLGLARGDRRQVANHKVAELSPDALCPGEVGGEDQMRAYAELWPRFFKEFVALCRDAPSLPLFHEGLLSLSERFTWAIPSSTIDQPDVPLHDHNKSVAAIAACLYRYHDARGELDNEAAIRDLTVPRFRFLLGDLSGIQSSLFRLASQQVSGAARILRARSFLMGATMEAVSLACRRELGLPPYCELLAAGGRFMLLVPNLDEVERRLAELQADVDRWLAARYLGDLSLNLALGPPLSGQDLMLERFQGVMEEARQAIELAKLNPLSAVPTGVLAEDYEAGADGACSACGVRPAVREGDGTRRCIACDDAHRLGRVLPKARAVLFSSGRVQAGRADMVSLDMPCGLHLNVLADDIRADDAAAWSRVLSGYRLPGADACLPHAIRHLANHVPRFGPGELGARRYRDVAVEDPAPQEGDIKTFAHIAADAREEMEDGTLLGRPMLAVLKADMDRLGQIFAHGLRNQMSVGRLAALSRMTDAFFTIVLPDLLRREFPNTYTVYAGGDDLLLVGPWNDMLCLADRIAERFRRHVGGNPDIALSAGIEFCSQKEPITRAVRRAEHRLEAAKDGGRNRVSAISSEPLSWPDLGQALTEAETVNGWIRAPKKPLSGAFVYRSLTTARERDLAERKKVLRAANWRARWAYSVSRTFRRGDEEDEQRLQFFDRLLGSGLTGNRQETGATAEPALTIALYRNR